MEDRTPEGPEEPDDGFTVEEISETIREVSLGSLTARLRRIEGRNIQLDTGQRGGGGRPSTGTKKWDEAIKFAKKWLHGEAGRRSGLRSANTAARDDELDVTLQHVVDIYREEKLGKLSDKEQKNVELAIDLVDATWGLDTRVGQVDRSMVDGFIEQRVEKGISFPKGCDRQDLAPVKPLTALKNLKTFRRVTSHAANRKLEGGRYLLEHDPFEAIRWPGGAEFEREHQEPLPEEVHVRLLEPWTDPHTGVEQAAPVDRIDPSGLLRCYLQVGFLTGHRENAIRNLLVGNLLFDEAEIRAALRRCGGVHRTRWAEDFAEHGAIYWSPELDKETYERVTPISRHLRPALDAYLETLPSRAPDAPLFPSPQDPTRPIGRSTLHRVRGRRKGKLWKLRKGGWFTEAVYLLRGQLAAEGKDPDRLIPLEMSDEGKPNLPWKAHGYRSLYATMLEFLGYGQARAGEDDVALDRHADFIGGWSIRREAQREERYAELDPAILKAAVDLRDYREALRLRAKQLARQIESRMASLERAMEASRDDTEPGTDVTVRDADEDGE